VICFESFSFLRLLFTFFLVFLGIYWLRLIFFLLSSFLLSEIFSEIGIPRSAVRVLSSYYYFCCCVFGFLMSDFYVNEYAFIYQ
jgi:Na+-transporting NADH:ubiquinone oxidoreductase subunit NqrB